MDRHWRVATAVAFDRYDSFRFLERLHATDLSSNRAGRCFSKSFYRTRAPARFQDAHGVRNEAAIKALPPAERERLAEICLPSPELHGDLVWRIVDDARLVRHSLQLGRSNRSPI